MTIPAQQNTIDDISRHIDEQGLICFLQEMVRTDSQNPPGNEDKVAGLIGDKLRSFGCSVEIQTVEKNRSNVIAHLPGARDEDLLFHGHTDTVQIGNLENWKKSPLGGVIEKGRLYGRGSCDMKGGVAAMIFAMEALKKSNVSMQRGIMFTGVIDEEINFTGIHHLLSQKSTATCTAAIVGEPTDLNICIAQKGALEYQVETYGKYAHSGMAFKGENAISHMMKIIAGLELYSDKVASTIHPLLQHPTLNVGTIHGGTGITFVPDRCQIEFDRQTLPGEEPQAIHRELQDLIQQIASHNGFRAELSKLQEFDAWEIDESSSLVSMLKKVYQQVLDKEALLDGFYAYSEADLLAKAGIPSLILGPGRIEQAHSPDEYVPVEQVINACRLYAALGYEFATGK